MNALPVNLMTPTPKPGPSASVPAARKGPAKPPLGEVGQNNVDNPKGKARSDAPGKPQRRHRRPVATAPDKSTARHRAAVKKKSPEAGKTGRPVALAGPNLAAMALDAQAGGSTKAGASTAAFAIILQAAGKTANTSTTDADIGKAPRAAALKGKAGAQGIAPARTAAQPAILETIASPVVTAPAGRKALRTAAQPSILKNKPPPAITVSGDAGVLQKAPPSARTKLGRGELGIADKDASQAAAPGENRTAALRMALPGEPKTQGTDPGRNLVRLGGEPGSESLRQSWLASVQSTASAASRDGRPPSPVAGPVAGKKGILQAGSAQKAKAAQAGLHKRLGALSHDTGRSVRFAVEELTGRSDTPGSDAGRIGAAGDIAHIHTVAPGAARPGTSGPSSPVNQIAEAFRSSAARQGQRIVIRLNPPELGRVRVMLRAEGNEVRGVLEADNPRTLSQLQRETPIIMNRLAEAGIQIKRMDLSLSDSGTGDQALFSQPHGENGTGHGGWDAPEQWRATDDTPPGGPNAEDEPPPAPVTIENDSINIWI